MNPNIDPNMEPNIDPNMEPNIEANIEPNWILNQTREKNLHSPNLHTAAVCVAVRNFLYEDCPLETNHICVIISHRSDSITSVIMELNFKLVKTSITNFD